MHAIHASFLFPSCTHRLSAFLSALILSFASGQVALSQDLEPIEAGSPNPVQSTSQNPVQKLSAQVQFYGNRYLIGPGDVLSYKVLHEPDYEQEDVLVRPDGNASFMGIGEMYVNNASITDITDMLREQLSETLVAPQVMVTVTNTKPIVIYLSGAVIRPGMTQFVTNPNDKNLQKDTKDISTRTDTRIFNVLANAGGVQMNADLSRVTVKRGKGCSVAMHNDPSACQSHEVNLWKLLEEADAEQDLMLYAGDSVYVPKLPEMALSDEQYDILLRSDIGPKKFPVRVIGEVNAPGLYDLDSQSAYLNTALARAGGYAPQANRKVLALRRFTGPNTFSTVFIDANKNDFTLRPNDVIYISETKLYASGRFMGEVNKVLSPFQSAGIAATGAAQMFGFGIFGGGAR